MNLMTVLVARSILASLSAGNGDTISTLAIFRAGNILCQDDVAFYILLTELLRRRGVDDQGLLPVQPKLSARMKAIAEGQPEPPTYPAPGMKYGFPEYPGWPEFGCDYQAVQDAFPAMVPA